MPAAVRAAAAGMGLGVAAKGMGCVLAEAGALLAASPLTPLPLTGGTSEPLSATLQLIPAPLLAALSEPMLVLPVP